MSELKPEAILAYLGFEVDKIKTEDDFKTQFENKFGIKDQLLKDPAFVGKIYGQKIGSIEAKIKANAKKMGVEFAADEIKDRPVEEVLEISFQKIADINKRAMEELEKSTKGTVDEQVKGWKDKYGQLESKFKDTEGLLAKTSQEFEGFKTGQLVKAKGDKINSYKKDVISKLQFKQDITPIEKVGFESLLNTKYDIDLDETENPFIKDKQTGQRVPSKKETGKFMSAEELFQEELIANKLAKINPQGGKPVPKPAYQPTGQQTAQADGGNKKEPYVHPRARQAMA